MSILDLFIWAWFPSGTLYRTFLHTVVAAFHPTLGDVIISRPFTETLTVLIHFSDHVIQFFPGGVQSQVLHHCPKFICCDCSITVTIEQRKRLAKLYDTEIRRFPHSYDEDKITFRW